MAWSDVDYRRAFADGHSRNEYVAGLIRGRGLWADCPPLRFARTKNEISDFTHGEKDVVTRAGTVEVKGQGKHFTDDPLSFPYATMIVDTVGSWDGKTEKPIAYVLVCMANSKCLVIPGSTRPQWEPRRLFDHKKEIYDDFYVAPKSCLRSMDDFLAFLERREREWDAFTGQHKGL